MKKYDYVIGIDPDSKASGFAWVEVAERKVQMLTLTFPQLLEKLGTRGHLLSTLIVVEASWLNGHHNWHSKAGEGRRVSSSKGYDIGRNHETGRKIVEMCQHQNMEVLEIHPLKKCWKGPDGKITHEELSSIFKCSGVEVDDKHRNRSNQEERDSAWIALNYSGIPIKIKVQTFKQSQQK